MRKDCILGCSIERLDMQVLLNPFEERLDSPTLSVEFCNGNCWKDEIISQESIHNVLSIVFICNQSQQDVYKRQVLTIFLKFDNSRPNNVNGQMLYLQSLEDVYKRQEISYLLQRLC